jgi:hypothetical protein
MTHARLNLLAAVFFECAIPFVHAQSPPHEAPDPLIESGRTQLAGHSVPYVIHQLPIDAFPALPDEIQTVLTQRSCHIPQTYAAHHPENVVHASLEHAGTSDWAVLCSNNSTVSLMVFFASAPDHPFVLATAPATERLQAHDPSGVLGFNWAIDPASPQRVHEAQSGMEPRPARPDHDALADSEIEHRTVFHFYSRGKWTLLDMPE